MDSQSMTKIRTYIEKGGKFISFLDIPSRDEYFELNPILSEIYRIHPDKIENFESVTMFSKKIEMLGVPDLKICGSEQWG